MNQRVQFHLELSAEDATVEQAAIASHKEITVESVTPLQRQADSALVEARFVDPVTILVSSTLAMLAVRMVNHWLKRDERGVQIDLRTSPATISQLRNVPAGVIVVIDNEGNASVRRENYDKPEDLLPTLTEIFVPK